MREMIRSQRLATLCSFGAGLACMSVSVFLISMHVQMISDVRDVSVPIVAALPSLERRLSVLEEQVELTELHTKTKRGSIEERRDMFALPEEIDLDRLLAAFEVVQDVLLREGLLSQVSDIAVSKETEDDLSHEILSLETALHDDGLKTLLMMVQLSGLLTVGDVLTDQERMLLTERIELENPAGIVALEQFLSVDLLDYAENPKLHEEHLKRSFRSTTFLNAFHNVIRTSFLRDVRELEQTGVPSALRTYKLWPLQMMAIDTLTIEPGSAPGWFAVDLKVKVFRGE